MVKIYIITLLFIYLTVNRVVASNPLRENERNNSFQQQAGAHSVSRQISVNRVSYSPTVSSTVVISNISNILSKVVPGYKGIINASHLFQTPDNFAVKQEKVIGLNLRHKGPPTDGILVGLADFVNSLSRIMVRHTFSRKCNMYSKFIFTERSAHIGLNF